jgi:hypothetical protein
MSFVNIQSNTATMTMQTGKLNTITSVFAPTSEVQNYIIVRDCPTQDKSFFITWLNSNGCWEYFRFLGNFAEGISIEDGFIAQLAEADAETSRFYTEIKASNQTFVFSQMIKIDELKTVAECIYSIAAQLFLGQDDLKETILIDKKSFTIFNADENKGIAQIAFSFNNSDKIPIQQS